MALAGELAKYVGGELFKNTGKELANKAATSALSNLAPKIATKAGTKVANKIGNEFIAGSILNSLAPTTRMLDKSGRPVTFYHSTPNEFEKFDDAMLGSNTGYENTALGHFVTPDKDFSKRFIDIDNVGKTGRTMELQANVQKPITHPYMAGYKYDNKDLDKIVEDYLIATNNQEGLSSLRGLAEEDGTNLYDTYMDLTFGGDSPFEYSADDRNALLKNGYDAVEIVEGPKSGLVEGSKDNTPISSYAIMNGDNLRPVRHLPVEEISSLSSIIPVKRKLYRGQQYSNTDFSYNSELMNENPDKWGSKDVGKGYHFTPKKDMAGSWEGSDGGVIEVDYTPDQVLKADDARKMIEEANKLLADDKYMAKLWQENEALAEQIEKIADGNLEALAKREGKPFVQHLKANDDELGTMYYYKDIDPELTDRFVSEFKQKAEKYIPNNNQQVDELVMPDANLSPQQQEFFKDSVVRDENGELIPMYHGSNSNFTVFDKSKGGQSNKTAKVGFWFTPNKEGAEKWAGQSWWGDNKPTVYETYLNIKKPYVYEQIDNSSQIAELEEQLKIAEDEINSTYRGSLGYYDAYKKYNAIAKQIEDLSYTDPYERFRSDVYAMEGKSPSQANTGGVGMVMDNEDEAVKKYVEMLKNEGYDGIIIKGTNYDANTMGGINDQYIVFDPEQIKNVDNLNPTDNPDIRMSKNEPSLVEMAKKLKAMKASQDMSDGIKRIGSDEVAALNEDTLPEGWKQLEKYLDTADTRLEKRLGKSRSKITKQDLIEFLDEQGYDTEGTKNDLWKNALMAIDDEAVNELYEAGGAAGEFLQNRLPFRSSGTMRDATHFYIGNKGRTGRLDAEYSDRLGIGRSNTPMADNTVSWGSGAGGSYSMGGFGTNPNWATGESGVSTTAHERFHAWQDINKFDWDERVGDAIDELRSELKKYYHNKDEIKKYWGNSKTDYYMNEEEQEARMLQSYLDNEGFTNTYRKSLDKGTEWGDEIKPAFDKFFKKLRALSKAGVALPAIAGLFGIGALANKKDDKKA